MLSRERLKVGCDRNLLRRITYENLFLRLFRLRKFDEKRDSTSSDKVLSNGKDSTRYQSLKLRAISNVDSSN